MFEKFEINLVGSSTTAAGNLSGWPRTGDRDRPLKGLLLVRSEDIDLDLLREGERNL
jgi:hypothetical protein